MNNARPSDFLNDFQACFRGGQSLSPNYDYHGDPSGSGLPGAGPTSRGDLFGPASLSGSLDIDGAPQAKTTPARASEY